jgi:phosphoglycolate phosphatase-like HAD superfamily hydrolase
MPNSGTWTASARVLLLFDIDGTLLLTDGAGLRAFDHVGRTLFGAHFSWDGIMTAGGLDPVLFAEAAVANGLDDDPAHHDRFQAAYLERLAVELEVGRRGVRAMPGIVELIASVRQRWLERGDVVPGLLTGNYTRAVPLKLGAVGLNPDWFEIHALGDEAPSRPDLAALALRRYERRFGAAIDPGAVVVIGDTPRDVHCAKAHGCVAFGVATGRYTVDDLRREGADVVVEDLADASPLWELVERLL